MALRATVDAQRMASRQGTSRPPTRYKANYLVDELRAQAAARPGVVIAVHVGDVSQEVVARSDNECAGRAVSAARGL